jgi:ubiquinone biosynthesis protein COQ4
MKLIQNMFLLKSFVAMLMGDSSLKVVDEMSYGLLDTSAFALMAEHLKRDPVCAELIDDRYIPPAHDLDRLLSCPKDSLGYIYAAAMKKSGFDPNLHAGMTAKSDAHYVEMRLSQTHDIWHILTGFSTSPMGEIGLQAFHLPQFPYPLATMLIANSLIASTLSDPTQLPALIAAIGQGWRMGEMAQALFGQKWEESWEKPLKQWQAELNIQPILSH